MIIISKHYLDRCEISCHSFLKIYNTLAHQILRTDETIAVLRPSMAHAKCKSSLMVGIGTTLHRNNQNVHFRED